MKAEKYHKKALFICSFPLCIAYAYLLSKNYEKITIIFSFSSQHNQKTKKIYKNFLQKNINNLEVIDLNFKSLWIKNRRESILEAYEILNQKNIIKLIGSSDVYLNKNCCPISHLISRKKDYFCLLHDPFEILFKFFPFIENLIDIYKYKNKSKKIIKIYGFLKLKNIFCKILNYRSCWDILEQKNYLNKSFNVILWPDTNMASINKEQINLARDMIRKLKSTSQCLNSIYIKFHPRHLSNLSSIDINKAIENLDPEINFFFKANALDDLDILLNFPIELVYIFYSPKKFNLITMSSSAAWNFDNNNKINISTYELDYILNHELKFIPKKQMLQRIILTLLSIKPPKRVFKN